MKNIKGPTKKVFVPNKGGHNYESAEQFGELIYVTEGTLNRFATSSIYRAFIDAMKDSSKDDLFLVTGMSVVNAIGAAVFARKHGCLNLLLYRNGEYVLREINVDSLIETEVEGEEDKDA